MSSNARKEEEEDALELVAQCVDDGAPARLVLGRLLRALHAREQLHVAQNVLAQLAQLARHFCRRGTRKLEYMRCKWQVQVDDEDVEVRRLH